MTVARLPFSINSSTLYLLAVVSNLRQSLEVHPDLINTIVFSIDEVHIALMNLQKDKACGPDCVPAYLFEIGAVLGRHGVML